MPKRMLKDWTGSETVDALTPQGEVFFTRLIMKADDYGVFPNNDRLLRSTLYPLKEYGIIEVGAWKNECIRLGIITVFNDSGRDYLAIKDFGQTLRRPKHTYPPPPDGQMTDNVRTSDGQVTAEVNKEVEVKVKAFGPTHSHFVVVKSKYLHEATARINGKVGLIEYMEHNQTVLNLPEHADKFMRANNGKVFNELSHLQNAYSLYIEKQYK